jgi:hypothetical protein
MNPNSYGMNGIATAPQRVDPQPPQQGVLRAALDDLAKAIYTLGGAQQSLIKRLDPISSRGPREGNGEASGHIEPFHVTGQLNQLQAFVRGLQAEIETAQAELHL